MMRSMPLILTLVAACGMAAGLPLPAAAENPARCALASAPLAPELEIRSAAHADAPVPHCKMEGAVGATVNFAVWLPDRWNGKFVMGGQGGFGGSVESQALQLGALERGFAVAGTDTGHTGSGIESAWALGAMERIVDYGHAAVHRVTLAAKFIARGYYGRPPEKSYFAGCSNGGRQGLMSAERYPDDFDAIVAGAPAIDFSAIATTFINAVRANYPEPGDPSRPLISAGMMQMIGEAVLASCDADDGLSDRIIADPTACQFSLDVLACQGPDRDDCLSRAQLLALNTIYDGPRQDGRRYGHGFPHGGELHPYGWMAWLLGARDMIAPGVPNLAYAYGVGYLRDFVMQDPRWSHTEFDMSGLEPRTRLLDSALSPRAADLSAFRRHGGKLLMYHGWADSGLSPFMSIEYVDRVYAQDESARDDVRLFMLPGVLHCAGGPGPDRIDYLGALDAWATSGAAPDELRAAFADGSGERKVCAHPGAARFLGGDGRQPQQFVCR